MLINFDRVSSFILDQGTTRNRWNCDGSGLVRLGESLDEARLNFDGILEVCVIDSFFFPGDVLDLVGGDRSFAFPLALLTIS